MNDRQKALEQKQRLEQLVIHLKMNLVDLADLAGLNKNTLYHVGSGEKSEITERSVARICYHLEKKRGIVVNREWLLHGTGEMIDEQNSVIPYEQEEEQPSLMATEEGAEFGYPDYREKYMRLMEEHLTLQKKYTTLLENKA
ncbi:MAG: helix-turn-helix transcriptional regulator [Rikenellaceae bacterium]|nr:helix-turn-helix transcriptional regulator [Rikenellaceae bacterium]